MSKITFRADDDLVDELEEFDASKSEVMREALRSYLEAHRQNPSGVESRPESANTASPSVHREGDRSTSSTIDGAVRDVVRQVVGEELSRQASDAQDVNVTVSLDGTEERGRRPDRPATAENRPTDRSATGDPDRPATAEADRPCNQCGEALDPMHVFCPNCGEKASRQIFCECGEEVRSDWSFCPGCGRRTPAADVLDSR